MHTITLLNSKDNYITGITTYLSILILNVNRLNFPIKKHQLAKWIKKEDPTTAAYRKPTSSTEISTG
jgi:hypothetical protein